MKNKRWRGAGVLAIALLFASGIAFGQGAQTGNIFVKASDEQGAGLPGVSVTLTGVSAPVTQVTNVNGEVRFLNLPPARYELDFALQGFGKIVRKNITVSVSQNTQIDVTMKLAGVQESVVVTGESPLLDTKKSGSSQTLSNVELAYVPTARDPWVVLATAPGVLIDRVNVGGSESGQQSGYIGKGTGTQQGTWSVDGVNITSMRALGSSPSYYDFDTFAEMNLATGGVDASIQTPGVQLNMVTKRGTNDVHGSARLYYESSKTSSTNVTDEMLAQQANLHLAAGSGNSVTGLQDYGAEIGGPVIQDKAWLWGSYGRNQIDLVVPGGVTDKTSLEGYSFKANIQAIPENTLAVSMMRNEKLKFGRGAAADHPQETTWNQTGADKIYKIEDSHIFSSDMFATASFARVIAPFNLISIGRGQAYQDSDGIWHNAYLDQIIVEQQTQANIAPSFFFRTGSVGHELKAGFTYRKTPESTNISWPGGIVACADGAPWCYGTNPPLAEFVRPGVFAVDMKSYSGYLSDTLTMNKLTVQLGVRYDYQWGQNEAFSVGLGDINPATWPGLPLAPLDVPGTRALIWRSVSPRAGASYAIDNQTIARLSYARFANQLGAGFVTPNSAAPGPTYLYYGWNDKNGNNRVDPGEADFNNLVYYYNWDPAHPNRVDPSQVFNQVDYNMKTPHTDEFILGAEHELMPAFIVGLQGTYRRMTDFIFNDRLSADGTRVLNPSDFTCSQKGPYVVPGGSPQYVNVCNPTALAGLGYLEHNRPGYYQTYWDINLNATKRYSDKWMARANFTYTNWTQHGLAEGMVDPSNLVPGTATEGGIVVVSPGSVSGAKNYVYMNAKWQGTFSGMYTLPLDFNVSTSMFFRQGYATPYYALIGSTNIPGISSKSYLLNPGADDTRLPAVFEWDLGLNKVVKVGPLAITLSADCFNVLNRNTVLQRYLRVRSTPTTANVNDNYVYEIQSPRIFRFGARLSF